jgi:3-methyladenine DNA glycosylase AlkD
MQTDPRIAQLTALLKQHADPAHAEFHRAYHKSARRFYGLRTPQFRALFREVFPTRDKLIRAEALPLVDTLAASDWAEERWAATELLARLVPQLSADDAPYLKAQFDACEGWGETDNLAINVLSPLALRVGEPLYAQVRRWSADPHLWTRRAAILVHIVPARRNALAHAYALPTFEERLPEREFFIRKALGWTLRECGKHYPQEVADFLLRVGDNASGLTRREGARNLPAVLRVQVLGK